MTAAGQDLDLTDPVLLARALVDIESVSGNEGAIADAVEVALRQLGHLEVIRQGNAVAARTQLGRAQRVILAGHLDTVPVKGNLPARIERIGGADCLVGRGAADMKGGLAAMLALAPALSSPRVDVTWIAYDCEEIEFTRSGLGRLLTRSPSWFDADFAVLGEPTNGAIEGGCNGTLRADVVTSGRAAHSARSWLGVNAIHLAAPILDRLAAYQPATIEVETLAYREGMNAVGIAGGIATNVIPDRCTVTVNYRFAPDKSLAEAEAHLRDVFASFDVTITDASPAARPGLDHPVARELVAASRALTGREPGPKYGWTDVARFAAAGIGAVNLGAGDPGQAHTDGEYCPLAQITQVHQILADWLA